MTSANICCCIAGPHRATSRPCTAMCGMRRQAVCLLCKKGSCRHLTLSSSCQADYYHDNCKYLLLRCCPHHKVTSERCTAMCGPAYDEAPSGVLALQKSSCHPHNLTTKFIKLTITMTSVKICCCVAAPSTGPLQGAVQPCAG
jgi:hypothetical protein